MQTLDKKHIFEINTLRGTIHTYYNTWFKGDKDVHVGGMFYPEKGLDENMYTVKSIVKRLNDINEYNE